MFIRHEGNELQEARIDLAAAAAIAIGHGRDHRILEPFQRLLHGQFVDLGRAFARIDGPAISVNVFGVAGWFSSDMTATAHSACTQG